MHAEPTDRPRIPCPEAARHSQLPAELRWTRAGQWEPLWDDLRGHAADPHDAEPTTIGRAFPVRKQHAIPSYQRNYVWTRAGQWEPLWDDLRGLSRQTLTKGPVALTGPASAALPRHDYHQADPRSGLHRPLVGR